MANNAYLLSSLKKGPIIVRWIVNHASPEIYDTKTDLERFTFREAIAHLADWEPILQERALIIKNQPGGTLQGYDETERAIHQNYAAVDPRVERWAAARDESIRFFTEEAPGVWDQVARHTERGDISMNDLANMEVAHDTYHIEHLLSFFP